MARRSYVVRKPPGETPLVKMAELSKRSGVAAPTIKHYIREGLLAGPAIRTSRNMAYYDPRVVDRIRMIKKLQSERFLPLRVIGTLLEPSPSAKIRPQQDAKHRSGLATIAPAVAEYAETKGSVKRRTRREVMKTFGLRKVTLDGLERSGVLVLQGSGETAGYAGLDLELLNILAEVHRLGLGEVFPATVAEPYLAAVKTLVELEIDLFRHRAFSTKLPLPLHDVARHAVELGERLVVTLRAKIMPGMLLGTVLEKR